MEENVPIPESWRPEVVSKWIALQGKYPEWKFSWAIMDGSNVIKFRAVRQLSHQTVDQILHPSDLDDVPKVRAKLDRLERDLVDKILAPHLRVRNKEIC